MSKALLHQHPHTVGTVVAAGESPAAGTHTHAHAPHCLQQSTCLRVSKHAHAALPLACPPHAAAPRVGVDEVTGGQCALSTSDTRGGYTYLSLVKRMCPWVRPSRASPPRTQLMHTPRRGVYSPPQARCRAHSHWLLGLSIGDGPTLRVGPPPSASLTAAPICREAACQRSVAGWGGSMSMRPITTPQPLMGSPALRGPGLDSAEHLVVLPLAGVIGDAAS